MILSYNKIEEIATNLTLYFSSLSNNNIDILPIETLAKQYLNLDIKYTKLSDDRSIYGLTAYADTEYRLMIDNQEKSIELKSNQILLDDIFIDPRFSESLSRKKNFTIAHECSHQILFGMEEEKYKSKYKKLYSMRKNYTFRELKTAEDWNEWQANVLGASILMPKQNVVSFIEPLLNGEKLTDYEKLFTNKDMDILIEFCEFFKVSKTAAIIRLKKLGYIVSKPRFKFPDSLDIWCD